MLRGTRSKAISSHGTASSLIPLHVALCVLVSSAPDHSTFSTRREPQHLREYFAVLAQGPRFSTSVPNLVMLNPQLLNVVTVRCHYCRRCPIEIRLACASPDTRRVSSLNERRTC
jgi:hypothetical protein